MAKGAVVSWPDKRPLYHLMVERYTDRAAFDSEFQNDPISTDDSPFGEVTPWISEDPDWLFFGAVDPSLGKTGKGRDPSAILVGGYSRTTGVLDVVEARIARRLPDKIIEDVIALQAQYKCLSWAVEAVQYQEFLRTELIKRGAARGTPVPAVPVTPHKDKALRIEALQPHVQNGLIRLHPSQTVLLQQLRHWPKGDHDDGPDALAMLWELATRAGNYTMPRTSGIRRATGGGAFDDFVRM
jgi:predicted phage terminase large subunit-like protein